MLSEYPITDHHPSRIQGISLPLHHQDKPGDQPVCKGFAIIVLARKEDAEYLQAEWPWIRNAVDESKTNTIPRSAEFQDAIKFGSRALSKVRWEQLREEYLAYRGRLVEEINAFEDAEPLVTIPYDASEKDQYIPLKEPPVNSETPLINLSSPYPPSSLVFVRNIHPETNKTTLRKFFATSLKGSLADGTIRSDGLDYVDFNKGMDSVSPVST